MPLFTKLNEIDPGAIEKVVGVPGDITHQRLGMSDQDWNMVTAGTRLLLCYLIGKKEVGQK